MEKLKVGDRVRIKRHDKLPWTWTESMRCYSGQIVDVDRIGGDLFYISGGWCFNSLNDVEEIVKEEPDSFETQIKQVATHLLQKPITSWEAINTYRITRLSAVIHELRKNNTITSVWESNGKVGKEKKRWTKYTLIK